jgi:5-methylcytosine-specific restriction endonuclease McrA
MSDVSHARARERREVRRERRTVRDFDRDDAGMPLGKGMPSGRSLRQDGDTHREAWMRFIRADPCSYCGGPGGTVDHIEPRSRRVRGIGGAHSWLNYAGACESCNGHKAAIPLLLFLRGRRPKTKMARMGEERAAA